MRHCLKLCVLVLAGIAMLLATIITWEHIATGYTRYRHLNNPAARHIRAMEDYQSTDYPPLPQPNDTAACPTHPLSNLPRPNIIVTSNDTSTVPIATVNSAIVFLVEFTDRPLKENHHEMMKFSKALWKLWENFSQYYPHYPVYVFHEPAFKTKYRLRYRTMWPPGLKLQFHEINNFDLPPKFPKGISTSDLGLNPTNQRAFPGYNNMIRFFWKQIFEHDMIKQLDYFWRLDHDSMLQSPVGVDVFHYMKERGIKYGYRAVTTDVRHVTNGMLAFFDKYRRNQEHQSMTNGTTCAQMSQRNCLEIPDTPQDRSEYFPLMYYNNFEIVHVPTWRSKPMRQLTDAVDKTDMIYWNRWGDAPLRYYSVNMMLDTQTQVIEWCNVRYYHHKQFEPMCTLKTVSSP
ncbi:glycolipid 2-alpha-mannosyltransferase-domain-containing protein [Zychaea mexicana]|uniref:glycolipid 2-alpha-mannosyltransferase-domain-containing protein n=1 Tax=Zychaea mexicana TaxID=64656 RepID=UPI0022FF03F7|nr:glycolipid 2-alpha-mannosyltransferase-domain-containing protein [Zychaea mexicana]KAI9491521.1 glycolipid 2-alpha-mannosyltransferase-domain-containing protein [Zychaea mexicana]